MIERAQMLAQHCDMVSGRAGMQSTLLSPGPGIFTILLCGIFPEGTAGTEEGMAQFCSELLVRLQGTSLPQLDMNLSQAFAFLSSR